MTDELTKTFFDTFGIEPKTIIEPRYSINTEYYEEKVEKYPQITDHILLELICFNNRHWVTPEDIICPNNIETIKESVLKQYIERNKEFVDNGYSGFYLDQVRTLFEEG